MMTKTLSVFTVLLLLVAGCATGRTVTHFSEESPLLYSGTRLDIHAISQNESILQMYKEKFGVEPPAHPKLDLPISFLLDTLVLIPIALPLALYNAVFE
jgi:uncharacterized protein YceK